MKFEISNNLNVKNIIYEINNVLIERQLLQPEQNVLIAISAGQDSICLLYILNQLRIHWKWKLTIIYCDHNWNINSSKQGTHICRLATEMKISFFQAISTQNVNTEQLARNWRYKIIHYIAIRHNYTNIMTGHTGSDTIETLIYNWLRGSGNNGLKSLSWKRQLNSKLTINFQNIITQKMSSISNTIYELYSSYKQKDILNINVFLIRPLLNLTRTQLKQIITNCHLNIWQDNTNYNFYIKRNRIRNQLMPYLRRHFNCKLDRILIHWADIVRAENLYFKQISNFIRCQIAIHIFSQHSSTYYIIVNPYILRSLPISIQRYTIKHLFYIDLKQTLNFEIVEKIRMSYSIVKTCSSQRLIYVSNQSFVYFYKYLIIGQNNYNI